MSLELRAPQVPPAPRAITKGVPLTNLLADQAIECLALNLYYVDQSFAVQEFCQTALEGIEGLSIMQRATHIARSLRPYLAENYSEAIEMLVASMADEQPSSEEFGLAGFFYLPHGSFIAEYGLDAKFNAGDDPFELSMSAMRALTKRFSAEFAIRDFLIQQPERSLAQLMDWVDDPCPHVRRLCSEGSRPKLPWGKQLKAFVIDPTPTLPILEALKNDPSLYVRRSVANHLGDIAKQHPQLVFDTCQRWLDQGSSKELNWLVRHAVRYHAKKQHPQALALRQQAKA